MKQNKEERTKYINEFIINEKDNLIRLFKEGNSIKDLCKLYKSKGYIINLHLFNGLFREWLGKELVKKIGYSIHAYKVSRWKDKLTFQQFINKEFPKRYGIVDNSNELKEIKWSSSKETNLKKYGTPCSFGYYKRTKYNSNPNSIYYLSDEAINSHNEKLKNFHRERFMNQHKNSNVWTSDAERKFSNLLVKLNYKFETQFRVERYWCDYYLPDMNLIIEIDGKFKYQDGKLKDTYLNRSSFIKSKGYKILHLLANSVFYYNYNLKELEELIKRSAI